MRILLVVWNFYPNTAYTNHTKATVRGMRECGCEVDVLSIKPLTHDDKDCIKGQRKTATSAIPTAWGMLMDFCLLNKRVKEYDVIYCATSDIKVINLVMRKARKHGLPVVHERTEMPDIFYSDTAKSQKALNRYLRKVSEFDKVFTISNPIRDYFIKKSVQANKIHIYPMIVDPHRFDCVKKQDVGYKYMAYCGNLSNSKDGVADLIEAYGRSRAKDSHKLILIGSKPKGEEQTLYDRLIKDYALAEKVFFRGQVSRDEMPQQLKDADVLLLSRPNNRQALGGFPTKLGEYLLTGNPVLVTRVGDIDKYIIDGENGYLAAPNDVAGFAGKIDYIVEHYNEALLVGKKGRDLALDSFNCSVQTRKVVDILKSLV